MNESDDEEYKSYDIAHSNQSNSTVIMSGELKKKGKFNKSWKNRWFQLSFIDDADSLFLSYYESKLQTKLCGSIKIVDIYQIMAIDDDDNVNLPPHSFILSSLSKQYIFAALNKSDLIQWIDILNKYINETRVVFEGYLMLKKEKTSNVWNKQYFILNQYGQLRYYQKKGRKDGLCGCILLSQIDEITHGKVYDDVCVFTLNLYSKSMKRKWVLCYQDKLHCLLYSKKMRDKWQQKIEQIRFKQVDYDYNYNSDELSNTKQEITPKKKKNRKKANHKQDKELRRAKSVNMYTLNKLAKHKKHDHGKNNNHKNVRKSRKKKSEKKRKVRKVSVQQIDGNRHKYIHKYIHDNRGKKHNKVAFNNMFAASKLSKISIAASHTRCNSDPTSPETPKLKPKKMSKSKSVRLNVYNSSSTLCGDSPLAHANVDQTFEINPKKKKKKKNKMRNKRCMSDIAKISKNRCKIKRVHTGTYTQSVMRKNKDKKRIRNKKAIQFSHREEQHVRETNAKWKYRKEKNGNVAVWEISTPKNVSNEQFDVNFV